MADLVFLMEMSHFWRTANAADDAVCSCFKNEKNLESRHGNDVKSLIVCYTYCKCNRAFMGGSSPLFWKGVIEWQYLKHWFWWSLLQP